MAVGGELIIGILGSFLYDAAKQPYRSLVSSIELRTAVSRSLRGGGAHPTASAKAAEKAISGLAKSIANGHGTYNEDVANFLREVGRSVVPDAVRDLVMAGRDPLAAFPVFDAIYRTFPDLPFQSRPLFLALSEAVRIIFEASVKDSGLLEVIRNQSRFLSGRLDTLEAAFSRKSDLEGFSDYATFNAARRRLAEAIREANSKISVETTEGPKHVDIDRIVIPARLRPTSHKNPAPPDSDQMEYTSLPFSTFRKAVHNAVVLGDPGGGKSTLTQYFCYELSRSLLSSLDEGEELSSPRLPIKIVLRNLEKRQYKSIKYNILDYICADVRLHFNNNDDDAKSFITQILSSGSAIVLFDGLDEILDISARQQMATQISEFIKHYPACPSIVTSRVVGYRDAPMGDDFSAFVLSRFNRQEVLAFSTNMIKEVKQSSKDAASDQASRFVSQTELNARDLRQNPLMLGLMVFLFMYKGDVPDNRPEIYRECTILMFQKWDKNRGIDVGLAADFKLIDLFCYLASNIFGQAETEEGVSEDWLYAQINGFFQSWYDNKSESTKATNKVLDFVTGRAWIMCAAGPGTFKFTHRTFLEYFFARNLGAEAGDVGKLIDRLLPHIINAEWDVVSHLALQISTFESRPQVERAAGILLRCLDSEDLIGDQKRNLLAFIARSLEYLTVPEKQLGDVIDRLMDEVLSSRAADDGVFSVVSSIIRNTEKRQRYTLKRINSYVTSAVTSGGRPARRAIYLMGNRGRFSPGYGYLGHSQSGTHDIFRALKPTRDALKQEVRATISSVRGARDYAFLYDDGLVEAVGRHGFSLISNGERGAPISYQLPILSAMSVLGSISYKKASVIQLARTRVVFQAAHRICADIITDPNVVRNGAYSRLASTIGAIETQAIIENAISATDSTIERYQIDNEDLRSVVLVLLAHLILLDRGIKEDMPRWRPRSAQTVEVALNAFVQAAEGSKYGELLRRLYDQTIQRIDHKEVT